MTDHDRTRGRELWNRHTTGETLSSAEQEELSAWVAVVEQTEASYLRPANDRSEADAVVLEERNRALLDLVARKERLAERLTAVAAEADSERAAIDAEVQRLLRFGSAVAASV